MKVEEIVEKSKTFELFRLPGSGQSLFPIYGENKTPTGTLWCSLIDPATKERINFETLAFGCPETKCRLSDLVGSLRKLLPLQGDAVRQAVREILNES